jgi:hypothetical protein
MKPAVENITVAVAVHRYGKKLIGVAAAACTGGFDHEGKPLVKGGFIKGVSGALSDERWLDIEVQPNPDIVEKEPVVIGCYESEQITLFWPQGGAA